MSDKPEQKSPEEALHNELEQAEELGYAIAKQGREITQLGQRLVDQAKATQQAAQFLPAQYDREQLIDDWLHVNRASTFALERLSHTIVHLTVASSTADTAYVNSTGTFTEAD